MSKAKDKQETCQPATDISTQNKHDFAVYIILHQQNDIDYWKLLAENTSTGTYRMTNIIALDNLATQVARPSARTGVAYFEISRELWRLILKQNTVYNIYVIIPMSSCAYHDRNM